MEITVSRVLNERSHSVWASMSPHLRITRHKGYSIQKNFVYMDNFLITEVDR